MAEQVCGITTVFTGKCIAFWPTEADIMKLQVGDLAPSAFGTPAPITQITCRRRSLDNRLFIHYYTKLSATSECSMSIAAGQITRDVNTTRFHTSAELDLFDVPPPRKK